MQLSLFYGSLNMYSSFDSPGIPLSVDRVAEKSLKIQCNVFLHIVVLKTQNVFSAWTIPEAEKDKTVPPD